MHRYFFIPASRTLYFLKPFGSTFLLLFLAVSCSHQVVVEDQDSILIRNRGSRTIHTLLVKPCTKPYEEFAEMAREIKPGLTTLIRLYPGCFDADALDKNGELMATQYKLRVPPQLRWDVH
ncbi:MAG: hypothetical protein OEZ57_13835 [Nitrospirota bacterium]|nr:hypothetical protein [Nitrospirota bacterium]MDH5587207.1 hypothetical protein [Nitrospirota bacterium]MDH5775983.1 hypothetical protein [Nitrospirota bacterium]